MNVLALASLSITQMVESCGLAGNSSPIVMSQTGFETQGPKIAILRADANVPLDWTVIDIGGAAVISGQTRPMGFDASAGETVHRIYLDGLSSPGEGFRIEICGTQSRPFTVGETPYARLAEDSLRYFYLNRLGTDLEAEFTGGEEWARAGGFMESRSTCFFGTDMTGTDWPGCDYVLETTGGWADAGDFGQYVVNGGISVWTLQYVFERFRSRGEVEAFGWDGQRVALPDTSNGVSEILLEARWHLEFMLALQIPDGERVWVDAREADADAPAPTEIDGSGLVHHKLHERHWLTLPLLPEDAGEPRFLIPPSTAATLNLAATAAQCSRVWRELDPAFADRCLAAAQLAFEAAQREPGLLARDLFDGGGAYGDLVVDDEFYWAATELFLATGRSEFRDAAQEYRERLHGHRPIFWANMELLAELSSHAAAESHPLQSDARSVILATARAYREEMEITPYLYPLPPNQITWGSNSGILNRALVLAAAHDIDPDEDFRDGVVHAMDYLLGRNPLDQSYIAGHGVRAMRHPHHRFWANGADPEYPEAPPGALSGGPNHLIMTDPVAREMDGSCAPQTCWVDHVAAYTMNEVAINWNAPLFAIAAYLEATETGPD